MAQPREGGAGGVSEGGEGRRAVELERLRRGWDRGVRRALCVWGAAARCVWMTSETERKHGGARGRYDERERTWGVRERDGAARSVGGLRPHQDGAKAVERHAKRGDEGVGGGDEREQRLRRRRVADDVEDEEHPRAGRQRDAERLDAERRLDDHPRHLRPAREHGERGAQLAHEQWQPEHVLHEDHLTHGDRTEGGERRLLQHLLHAEHEEPR
eukprot:7388257-Prymnesium_polylepis.1